MLPSLRNVFSSIISEASEWLFYGYVLLKNLLIFEIFVLKDFILFYNQFDNTSNNLNIKIKNQVSSVIIIQQTNYLTLQGTLQYS
jgi:hypothetical protein